MKQIMSVLILLASVMMLSGCFWVIDDTDGSYTQKKYSITFCNYTDDDVIDWYVKNSSGENFMIIDGYNVVTEGSTSRLKDLKKDDYKVYYSFIPDNYYETNYVKLDEDLRFVLTSKTSYTFRSN